MERLELHYSVQNGGDGSAYPQFFDTKGLCEFDQECMDEGWGESCTGTIILTSETPITHNLKITTKQDMIDDYILSMSYCMESRKKEYRKIIDKLIALDE